MFVSCDHTPLLISNVSKQFGRNCCTFPPNYSKCFLGVFIGRYRSRVWLYINMLCKFSLFFLK